MHGTVQSLSSQRVKSKKRLHAAQLSSIRQANDCWEGTVDMNHFRLCIEFPSKKVNLISGGL